MTEVHRGGVLIPQDWGPYEKKPSGSGHTQRDGPVSTGGGDGHLHAREGGPGGPPCPHQDVGFQPPVRKQGTTSGPVFGRCRGSPGMLTAMPTAVSSDAPRPEQAFKDGRAQPRGWAVLSVTAGRARPCVDGT